MQLDNSNKILLDYVFSYMLVAIQKINLNDEQCQQFLCREYFKRKEDIIKIN